MAGRKERRSRNNRIDEQISSGAMDTDFAFISGLPDPILAVVQLWKRKSRDKTFNPVQLFWKAKNWKKLTVNYSHSSRIKGRHIISFYRYKKIVKCVQKFASVFCAIIDQGRDYHWENTFQIFSNQFNFKISVSKTKSVSGVLTIIKKNAILITT